jgi:long-chain acyl-CoA synthetase
VAAMIAVDMSTVGKWAEQRGLPYTSYVDLSGKPEVARLIIEEVGKINATLPGTTKVARIVLLNKELDADDAEITRTRKVRRGFVAEKYAPLIAALYDGGIEASMTMDITFEDGRKSSMTTTLKIHDIVPAHGTGSRMAA